MTCFGFTAAYFIPPPSKNAKRNAVNFHGNRRNNGYNMWEFLIS
jgi:hypothetical protein